MDTARLELLYRYALEVAAQEDFPNRELGPIHLLKYAYLADQAYAEKHRGKTFTGTRWKFHHFGPWSPAAHKRIGPAMAAIGATERHFRSRHQEDHVRWRLPRNVELGASAARLPHEAERAIRRWVHEFGADTVSLLHHVYKTPPMLRAAPGEFLDFSPESAQAPVLLGEEDVGASKPLPHLSKTTLKKLKALLREKLDQQQRQPRLVPPEPAPRYDEVFERGRAWLDSLAGAPIANANGTLEFAGNIWKSRARRENELP